MSFVGLTGCHLEADAPSDNGGEEPVTGKAVSGLQVTAYDFVAHAAGAAWANEDGGLSWETNDTRGACLKATGAIGNGVSSPYLLTRPKSAANGSIRGCSR